MANPFRPGPFFEFLSFFGGFGRVMWSFPVTGRHANLDAYQRSQARLDGAWLRVDPALVPAVDPVLRPGSSPEIALIVAGAQRFEISGHLPHGPSYVYLNLYLYPHLISNCRYEFEKKEKEKKTRVWPERVGRSC